MIRILHRMNEERWMIQNIGCWKCDKPRKEFFGDQVCLLSSHEGKEEEKRE
jgi:hypothetical protein